MKSSKNNLNLTVQGVNNPVPAAEGSGNAGSRSSISYDCLNKQQGEDMSTTSSRFNNEAWSVENPFRRNSGIVRSPPTAPTVSSQVTKSTPNEKERRTASEDSSFVQLGSLITELIEYMKPKLNVHHAIKEKARAIKAMYNKTKNEGMFGDIRSVPEKAESATQTNSELREPVMEMSCSHTLKAAEKQDLATQTSPKRQKPEKDLKRIRESEETLPKIQLAKKRKVTNQEQTEIKENGDIVPENNKTGKSTYTEPVKQKKGPRKRKPKKEAVIISKKGEATYADILKHIKTDPSLKDLGECVSRIRRTLKGDLLLEIENNNKNDIVKFREQIETSVGQQANVKTYRQEILVECKDIDEITSKSDICEALNKQLGISTIKESDIKGLRKGYGGTQTAIISLPEDLGRKVLDSGKIRIGWVICRIREKIMLKKCFRCLEYGHTTHTCRNPQDRSKLCRRCGVNGHISRECSKDPECMFCKQEGKSNINHVAGSRWCPVFLKALDKIRK